MNRQDIRETEHDQFELGQLTNSLGFLLRLAQVRVFNAFYDRLSRHNLRPGEFTVLWVIGLNPGLKQGSIARRLSIKPAHMTKLIQRMVADGYVERDIPAEDRRAVHLSLTPEGQKFVERYRSEFLEFHREERSDLSEGEHAELMRLLRKFTGIGDHP